MQPCNPSHPFLSFLVGFCFFFFPNSSRRQYPSIFNDSYVPVVTATCWEMQGVISTLVGFRLKHTKQYRGILPRTPFRLSKYMLVHSYVETCEFKTLAFCYPSLSVLFAFCLLILINLFISFPFFLPAITSFTILLKIIY